MLPLSKISVLIEYDVEIEASSDEIALYYRNGFVRDKNGKRKFEKLDIPKLYNMLNKSERHIIINLVKDLLPEKKRDAHIGVYLNAFLEKYNLTYYSLAKVLCGYMQASIRFDEYIDLEDMKSKTQKLLKSSKPMQDNKIIELIADYFNVSLDVLIKGEGVQYSIDYERLLEIADNEKLNADDFLRKHFETDYNIDSDVDKNAKEMYEHYIHQSARIFAEIAAEEFDVTWQELLFEEEIWIEWDDKIFIEICDGLSEQNREIVYSVLKNMYLGKITK